MKIKIYLKNIIWLIVFFPLLLTAEGLEKRGLYDATGTNGRLRLEPQARIVEDKSAQRRIPIEIIRPYLNRAQIVSFEDLQLAPYILAPEGEHLITATGNSIYARGFQALPQEGEHFGVYEKGDVYRDPATGEVLGVEAVSVGLSVVKQSGDPVTLLLTDAFREVLMGDRLLPDDTPEVLDFEARVPEMIISTRILAVYDGVTQIGQYNVVVVQGGVDMGLEPGHMLHVFQAGAVVDDPYAPKKETVVLPDVYAGEMMVFRVFDKLSLAVVLDAKRPMHVLDKVKST